MINKHMIAAWIVSIVVASALVGVTVWKVAKPKEVASDEMMRDINLVLSQCANQNDVIKITGGGASTGGGDKTTAYAHYYIGCSLTNGVKSEEAVRPINPVPLK